MQELWDVVGTDGVEDTEEGVVGGVAAVAGAGVGEDEGGEGWF